MKCLHCGSDMKPGLVALDGEYRGQQVRVEMQGVRCVECGYSTIRGRDMDEFGRRVKDAYKQHERLLDAAVIREARQQMGATQKSFAEYLDVGIASVKRIETG